MKPLPFRLLLAALLSIRAAAGQVESAPPVQGASSGNPAAGVSSLALAPQPIALAVVSPNAALSPASPLAFAAPPAAVAAAAAPAEAPRLAPALLQPAALPAAFVPAGSAASPTPSGSAPTDGDSREDSASAEGRALFDAAAPSKPNDPGIWTKLKGLAGLGDRVPAWPGTPGERVRLGGRTFILSRIVADGGSARTWRTPTADFNDYTITILNPKIAPPPGIDEAALKAAGIPHVRLAAASADGRVTVKELFDGPRAAELLGKSFAPRQREGWAELAAKMIRARSSANLAPGNLIWHQWESRWLIDDARGTAPAAPDKVVEQLLTPASRGAGVDAGVFLSAVRGRLGPDSRSWKETLAALRATPKFERDLEALAAYDRALPPPPEVVFAPASGRSPYPDRVGPPEDAATALGYGPLATGFRRALHSDDPGKTNTRVFAVEPEGKPHVAVKMAQWSIIRNELALRRVIRRWFGRYFDTPSSFGVKAGANSYLVMELMQGSKAYASNPLTREQRAALAVLVHAFGISDMNPGNVLFPAHELPELIDFEVALNRSTPNATRIGDEGIALEMPWASRFETNRAEDYQPAVRAWRALMAEPSSAAALRADFKAAGFSADEAEALLETVARNTADLDWTIQNDVDFVNQFVAAKSAVRR